MGISLNRNRKERKNERRQKERKKMKGLWKELKKERKKEKDVSVGKGRESKVPVHEGREIQERE